MASAAIRLHLVCSSILSHFPPFFFTLTQMFTSIFNLAAMLAIVFCSFTLIPFSLSFSYFYFVPTPLLSNSKSPTLSFKFVFKPQHGTPSFVILSKMSSVSLCPCIFLLSRACVPANSKTMRLSIPDSAKYTGAPSPSLGVVSFAEKSVDTSDRGD